MSTLEKILGVTCFTFIVAVILYCLYLEANRDVSPDPNANKPTLRRAVCFSTDKNIRLNMEDYDITISDNSLLWSNGEGRYIFTLPPGYMCSVVPVLSDSKEGKQK